MSGIPGMRFLIFFSVEKLGRDGRDGLGNLLKSGVKRFTVAQALRQRAAISTGGTVLRKRDIGFKKIRSS